MTYSSKTAKAKTMDEKELGPKLIQWLSANFQFLTSGAMAVSIAFARIAYEYASGKHKRTWGASVSEGILLGLFAMGIAAGLEMFKLPQSAATFFGAMVGFLGVEKIKSWLEAWGDKKLDNGEKQEPKI